MIFNERHRDAVMKRLIRAGWISGPVQVMELEQSGGSPKLGYQVQWTERGWAGRRALHILLADLGYDGAHLSGEVETLWMICRLAPNEQPPGSEPPPEISPRW